MKITRFEDIEAWKAARTLNQKLYKLTQTAGFHGDYALARQIRRASVSIMANIAEGFDGGTDAEFVRFLKIAKRSASEVQSHLYVALDQEFIDSPAFETHYASCTKVKGLIGGFIRYLRAGKRAP